MKPDIKKQLNKASYKISYIQIKSLKPAKRDSFISPEREIVTSAHSILDATDRPFGFDNL